MATANVLYAEPEHINAERPERSDGGARSAAIAAMRYEATPLNGLFERILSGLDEILRSNHWDGRHGEAVGDGHGHGDSVDSPIGPARGTDPVGIPSTLDGYLLKLKFWSDDIDDAHVALAQVEDCDGPVADLTRALLWGMSTNVSDIKSAISDRSADVESISASATQLGQSLRALTSHLEVFRNRRNTVSRTGSVSLLHRKLRHIEDQPGTAAGSRGSDDATSEAVDIPAESSVDKPRNDSPEKPAGSKEQEVKHASPDIGRQGACSPSPSGHPRVPPSPANVLHEKDRTLTSPGKIGVDRPSYAAYVEDAKDAPDTVSATNDVTQEPGPQSDQEDAEGAIEVSERESDNDLDKAGDTVKSPIDPTQRPRPQADQEDAEDIVEVWEEESDSRSSSSNSDRESSGRRLRHSPQEEREELVIRRDLSKQRSTFEKTPKSRLERELYLDVMQRFAESFGFVVERRSERHARTAYRHPLHTSNPVRAIEVGGRERNNVLEARSYQRRVSFDNPPPRLQDEDSRKATVRSRRRTSVADVKPPYGTTFDERERATYGSRPGFSSRLSATEGIDAHRGTRRGKEQRRYFAEDDWEDNWEDDLLDERLRRSWAEVRPRYENVPRGYQNVYQTVPPQYENVFPVYDVPKPRRPGVEIFINNTGDDSEFDGHQKIRERYDSFEPRRRSPVSHYDFLEPRGRSPVSRYDSFEPRRRSPISRYDFPEPRRRSPISRYDPFEARRLSPPKRYDSFDERDRRSGHPRSHRFPASMRRDHWPDLDLSEREGSGQAQGRAYQLREKRREIFENLKKLESELVRLEHRRSREDAVERREMEVEYKQAESCLRELARLERNGSARSAPYPSQAR